MHVLLQIPKSDRPVAAPTHYQIERDIFAARDRFRRRLRRNRWLCRLKVVRLRRAVRAIAAHATNPGRIEAIWHKNPLATQPSER